MGTVLFLITVAATLYVVDRFAHEHRPVESSDAYRQACTGLIREPPAHMQVVEDSRPCGGIVATEGSIGRPEPHPVELVVRPA